MERLDYYYKILKLIEERHAHNQSCNKTFILTRTRLCFYTITPIINQLELMGFIQLNRCRQGKQIRLTDKGQLLTALFDKVRMIIREGEISYEEVYGSKD